MIVIISNQNSPKISTNTKYWYDSFFKKMREFDFIGYQVRTNYSPYCIINSEPVEIKEAVAAYQKHNSLEGYSENQIVDMMKKQGLVFYDYIQEAQAIDTRKDDDLSMKDVNKMDRLLQELGINYDAITQRPQGIYVEIDELELEDEEKIENFLEEIQKEYKYRII